jgi:DNA primase
MKITRVGRSSIQPPRFTPAFLEELRARTPLSGLIGKSLKLQRAGREWKACCPFHEETTPSFTVNDDKGFYHCFGCAAHGDAIDFVTETRGMLFVDAVKELAQAAGMALPPPDAEAAAHARRVSGLHRVMAAATRWFEEQLDGEGGAAVRAYLDRRAISEPVRRAFGLGFAPDSRKALRSALARAGDDKLIEAGLLISVDTKEPYDRFRGRLIIPIRDARGRTIAIGGRIVGDGEPKYLNSPETPLFDKGRTLFNLDRAGPASRKAGRIIVVEGYLDVIALAQGGIDEVVAPLGTALTEEQIEQLWQLADVPILCFDGDAAGQKAAIRAALRALPLIAPGRSLRFVTLPPDQDPDDLVREGGRAAIDALLERLEPLDERIWRHELEAEPLVTPEARAGLRQRLLDHVTAIRHRGVRDQYRAEYLRRCEELFARVPATRRSTTAVGVSGGMLAIAKGGIDRVLVRSILAGLLHYPDLIAIHAAQIRAWDIGEEPSARIRDALLTATGGRSLTAGALLAMLSAAGLDDDVAELRRSATLPFSFLREPGSDRGRADLVSAIAALTDDLGAVTLASQSGGI